MAVKKEIIKTVAVFACDYCSFEGTEKETKNHETLKHKIKTINLYEDVKLHYFNSIDDYKLYCKAISSYINLDLKKYLPGYLISWADYGRQFISAEMFLKNIENESKQLEEKLQYLKIKENKIKECLQKS